MSKLSDEQIKEIEAVSYTLIGYRDEQAAFEAVNETLIELNELITSKDAEIEKLKAQIEQDKQSFKTYIETVNELEEEVESLKAALAEKKGMQWVKASEIEKVDGKKMCGIRGMPVDNFLTVKWSEKDGVWHGDLGWYFTDDELLILVESSPLPEAKQEDKTTVDRFDLLNKAIDVQHAKQEAISFFIYCHDNGWEYSSHEGEETFLRQINNNGEYRLFVDVYSDYLEQKQKEVSNGHS